MNIPLTVVSANPASRQSVIVLLEGGGATVTVELRENLDLFKPGQAVLMRLNTWETLVTEAPQAPEKPVVESKPRPAPVKAPAKKKSVAKPAARPKAKTARR